MKHLKKFTEGLEDHFEDETQERLKPKVKQEPKQETFEEAGKFFVENTMKHSFNSMDTKTQANRMLKCVEFGAKWQQERSYSEEEVLNLLKSFKKDIINSTELNDDFETLVCDIKTNKWFEQFKKK